MKHTLLATTALVAMTGAAAADFTVSGSARIGFATTEGAAAVTGSTTYNAITTKMQDTLNTIGANAEVVAGTTETALLAVDADTTVTSAEYVAAVLAIDNTINDLGASAGATAALAVVGNNHIASLKAIKAALRTVVATTAKASDQTVAKNRMRVKFAGSGETSGGLAFGGSFSAHDSVAAGGTGSSGTQYISGAFGKVSMGDLNGADEQVVGDLAGVGFSGAGSHHLYSYQSSAHNLGYKLSMSGIDFAVSTDLVRGADSTKTGSNSAMGISWAGDMGGTAVKLGVGSSKKGTATETSASLSVSMGGLTVKALTMTNDNGKAVDDIIEAEGTTTITYASLITGAKNVDTDTTGLSISYSMDALSVTAFTRSEDDNTAGTADKDWSGVGFAYDLGGASLKAGFVDANDISVMDFGLTFSF